MGIIDLTKGEMGTRGTEQTRAEEVKKASEILNISYRQNLDLGDSILANSRENQIEIIKQLRLTRPHICLVGAPFDRHPDHPKGTNLVLDALFYSGLKKLKRLILKGKFKSPGALPTSYTTCKTALLNPILCSIFQSTGKLNVKPYLPFQPNLMSLIPAKNLKLIFLLRPISNNMKPVLDTSVTLQDLNLGNLSNITSLPRL